MRTRGIVGTLTLSLVVVGCASRRPRGGPPAAAFDRTAETKAVYVAVLRDQYATDWVRRPVTQWVVSPDIPAVSGGRADFVRERFPDLRRDTLADYERPRPAGTVPPDLDPGLPVRWFSDAEFAALPKESSSDLGWTAFHRRFPGSPGHVTLSRVGFSSDGTEALLTSGCWFDGLGGASQLVRLRKIGGIWRVQQTSTTAVS